MAHEFCGPKCDLGWAVIIRSLYNLLLYFLFLILLGHVNKLINKNPYRGGSTILIMNSLTRDQEWNG